VLATSIGYSLLALWWAIDQFAREDVLFREAERFDLRLWIRHLLRDKEPTPSFAEAGLCFVMIMLLQFAGMRFFRGALPLGPDGQVDLGAAQPMMLKLLLIQQLAVIATPALFMGVILTTSVRRTFRLRMPPLSLLLAAVVLPVVLHPLTVELSASLQWFFPPLPKSVQEVLTTMSSAQLPLGFLLLAFAVAPAICEEIAFRGFMLSGFARSGRVGVAIGMSSLAFGLMHMIPQQVFNAALLGTVLGLLAVRAKSLLPCVVFHLIYNSLAVLHARYGSFVPQNGFAQLFFAVDVEEGGLRYNWPTLVVSGAVALLLLRMVVRFGKNFTVSEAARSSGANDSDVMPDRQAAESSHVTMR
jgi:sodium transport system permease protein